MVTTQRSSVRFPRAPLTLILRASALLGLFIGLLGMHFSALAGMTTTNTAQPSTTMQAEAFTAAAAPSAGPQSPASPSATAHGNAAHPGSGHAADCHTDCAVDHSLGAACATAFPLLVLALRRPKTYSRLEPPGAVLLKLPVRIIPGIASKPSLVELSISRT